MALVKSGWLWRQSSVLRRWKKHWFDLWLDGGLVYYPDDTRQNVEERIVLKNNCVNVRSGQECGGDVQPPEGSLQDSLLVIDLRDVSRLWLCAESEDDAVAWKFALLDARSPMCIYNPYDDNYHTVPVNAHQAVYVDHGYCGHGYGPGMAHVIVRDNRDSYGQQMVLGLLAGALTSSALSSLIWLPCWF
ncbi:pleckstrin homology domain-containing family B member 1 [Engystomops pustulosus]|uniref:pleckstrin homology domain-containing family B member 1 n=1 Tax=Engystomops pustulosus TaxID=76066 RepID=UPI003AFB1489